ncbi:MAG: sigma factor [Actinomycetota bacterium]
MLQRSERLLRQQARKHAELPEDAEDALQSAYVLFIERYRGDWEPLAWLYTTVKREAWGLRRKVSRRRAVSLDTPSGSADSEQPWVVGLPSAVPDPEEKALRSEEIDERRQMLAALKADQRRALGLFGAGLSYAEICQATGWTYTNDPNPHLDHRAPTGAAAVGGRADARPRGQVPERPARPIRAGGARRPARHSSL